MNRKYSKFRIQYLVYSIYFLQTPVIKGEERNRFEEIKQIISAILSSQIFYLAVLGIIIVIGIIFLYNRKKSIPELELELIQEDTWFTTRDDNNRVAIVVSVKLNNRATRGIRIVDCKLSGYSTREGSDEIRLEGAEEQKKINFPGHKHFFRGQGELYLGPYSSVTLWFYYESRAVTMRNVLQAPLTVKCSDKRRKSIRITIPRHADQIAIYQEMARMW